MLKRGVFEDLSAWREHFVLRVVLFIVLFVPIGFLLKVRFFLEHEHYGVIIFDVVAWTYAVLVLLVGRGGFRPSRIYVLIAAFCASTAFHMILGPNEARPVWLALTVVLAAVLYGFRGVAVFSIANAVMLMVVYSMVPESNTAWSSTFEDPHSIWLTSVANKTLLNFILGMTVSWLVGALELQLLATRASQDRSRLVEEHVSDVVWTMDMDLRTTFITPSIRQLRGLSVEEAMDESIDDSMGEESASKAKRVFAEKREQIAAGFETGWDPVIFDAEQPCKDGGFVDTSIHLKFVDGGDGRPSMIVGVTRNISDYKRAESEREEMRAQLNSGRKMEAIGRLAGGVAHDFNNVLSAITGNAALVKDDLEASDPHYELMEGILSASQRAANLTKQLLAFSRKQLVAPQLVDLNALIENLHMLLARIIGENIKITTLARAPNACIHVDPSQMEQVVLNLAINARDAMQEGGDLVIETTNVTIDESARTTTGDLRPGVYTALLVRDTGTGISAEVQERMFEPFFTTKEVGKGTGLGLATLYAIVERSGGSIDVKSSPGKGTEFRILFPARAKAPRAPLAKVHKRAAGGSETILVVEDEEIVRKPIVRLLKRLGYQVLSAGSAAEALAVEQEHAATIDLLFTDVVMPGRNGRELAEDMRTRRPGIKVIFTSGYTQDVFSDGDMPSHTNFIGKPHSFDKLATLVRTVLEP
jgi:PAS domain S-box-containing protein